MEKPKLLPCPFCASTDVQVRGSYARFVICLNCEGATGLYDNREDAIKAWNMRGGKVDGHEQE